MVIVSWIYTYPQTHKLHKKKKNFNTYMHKQINMLTQKYTPCFPIYENSCCPLLRSSFQFHNYNVLDFEVYIIRKIEEIKIFLPSQLLLHYRCIFQMCSPQSRDQWCWRLTYLSKRQEFELGAENYHLSKEMEVRIGTGLVQSLKTTL